MTIPNQEPAQAEEQVALRYLQTYCMPATVENIEKHLAYLRRADTIVRFGDKVYYVANAIYDLPKPVQLPDGRQVTVGGWLESLPPQTWGTLVDGPLATDFYQAVEAP